MVGRAMKTLTTFKNACSQLLEDVDALESRNRDLLVQLERQRALAKQDLLKQAEEQRALVKQIMTLARQKRRAEAKHSQQLQEQRARAAEFRAKMCEYRRDLVALRTQVRKTKT